MRTYVYDSAIRFAESSYNPIAEINLPLVLPLLRRRCGKETRFSHYHPEEGGPLLRASLIIRA